MNRVHFPLALVVMAFLSAGCSSSPEEATTPSGMTVPLDGPINTKCPVMNYPVSPKHNVTYKGKTIGLCCEACGAKWSSLTDEERDILLARVGVHL